MPSEKWTPRFGERVRVITVGGKNPLAVVLDPQVDSEGRAIYSVRFAHGQDGDYYASELEPAPDPAVAALDIPEPKNAQWYRDRIKWGSYYGEPNDVFSILQSAADKENMLGIAWAIIEAANKLAAKGGAE